MLPRSGRVCWPTMKAAAKKCTGLMVYLGRVSNEHRLIISASMRTKRDCATLNVSLCLQTKSKWQFLTQTVPLWSHTNSSMTNIPHDDLFMSQLERVWTPKARGWKAASRSAKQRGIHHPVTQHTTVVCLSEPNAPSLICWQGYVLPGISLST